MYSALLVDIDGDGDLDVVISNDTPDPKLVYLNDGKDTFHVGSTYSAAETFLESDAPPTNDERGRGNLAGGYRPLDHGSGRVYVLPLEG